MNRMRLKQYIIICFLLTISATLVYYLYPYDKIASGVTIDEIIVLKSKHQLLAYAQHKLIHTYPIAIGKNPVGDKQYEGDMKTPEGDYKIFDKNPSSAFHKNLGISY